MGPLFRYVGPEAVAFGIRQRMTALPDARAAPLSG